MFGKPISRREAPVTATTIEIPAEQVEAIRQSLLDSRDRGDSAAAADLLAQLAAAEPAAAGAQRLSGPRTEIWTAIYDALCVAAEQLVEDCNEYWHGHVAPAAARRRVRDVAERLELLIDLGAPPGRPSR
jgi:hypothetical protein